MLSVIVVCEIMYELSYRWQCIFSAPIIMSLISYALLDVWSHVMLMLYFSTLEHLCCFCSNCCLLEMVALVVPCCYHMIMIDELVDFICTSYNSHHGIGFLPGFGWLILATAASAAILCSRDKSDPRADRASDS